MEKIFKNILISRTDNLGDSILTLPLVNETHKIFPDAKINILAKNYTRELYENLKFINKVFILPEKKNVFNLFQLIRELRKENIDLAILVYPRFIVALVLFFSKIKIRTGTGYRWYSFLLNHKNYEHRKYSTRHESEYNMNLLKYFSDKFEYEINFGLKTNIENKIKAKEVLSQFKLKEKKFVIIHPLSFGSSKKWPIENFMKLSDKILSETKFDVLFTGTLREEKIIKSKYKSGKINFISGLKIMDFAAVIEKSKSFISNSTGPLHLAAIVNTPVVSFFSPVQNTNPTRWEPITKRKKIFVANNDLCSLCNGGKCKSNLCMEAITVNSVFSAVLEVVRE